MPTHDADLTRLPGWDSVPADLRTAFVEARLPVSFLERSEDSADFVVGPDLREIDIPGLGRVVRFARRVGGFGGDFCVHPTTGAVWLAIEDIPPNFVNSTVLLLGRTIRLAENFTRRFTTGDADGCWAAAEEFRAALEELDEPAAHPDAHWGGFAADAGAGDYSEHEDF